MFPTDYEEEIFENLSSINEHVKVWKKSQIPPEYHYSNNKRIPPVLMAADEGWGIKENWDDPNYLLGRHGFNNSEMDMHPIFLAVGPAFKKGYVSKPFESVNIYELMCNILQVKPAPNNGSLDNIRNLLADDDDAPRLNIFWHAALAIGVVIFVVLMTCTIKELFKPYWKKPKMYNYDRKEEKALLAEA